MADGASEEIEPSLCRRESHVTDEPHGIETTFDYLDMIENLQFSLDTPTVEKLCEYFHMTSSIDKIRASNNPQRHFLLECRRECIITRKDTTKLLQAFKKTGLSNLQSIIEDYNHVSKCPVIHVTVNNDNPTSAFSSFKTFLLSNKRAIKSVLTRDRGIHFVDCKEGSLVICLKVSSVEELDKLKDNIESGILLRRLMATYESEISDTERKDFQSEKSSTKLSYDTEEFENAKQQLTTNNASFCPSRAVTKFVIQTKTETFIFLGEMKEVVDPRSVVQSLSRGGCSVTSEDTQRRIGATTSQKDMEVYYDALSDVSSLSENDDEDSEEDFLGYLDEVGLKEYFPRKLTMKEATEVRLFPSDDSQIDKKDLPFLFISKLTSLDSRITLIENLHIEGSARDFIYAILHCSDNHLRQHLLEKFASCQLAVPVLLPGVRDDAKPELLTWALSRVVKKWKENETSLAPEKLMVREPVFTTAFIRFGDIPISKSSALNNAIGKAQGNGTFQYFISYEDEKKYAYQSCGSVEAQWYLPMFGRKEDLLKEVTLLLNLRGDSNEFTTEREFMCRIANAIFLFVDKRNLECYKTAIWHIKKRFKNVFVIHLIAQKDKKGKQTRKQQLKSKKLKVDENDNSVDFGVERNVTELSQIICKKIVQYCTNTSHSDYRSIKDWRTLCCNAITVDQDIDSYKRAKQLLHFSFPMLESIEEMKKSYLQLQVEWGKWVEADKKPLCVGVQTVERQFEAKEKTKRDMRQIQRKKGLSEKMKVFFENLQTIMFDESDLLHYFMSIFQTHLEIMATREIPPFVKRIDELNTSLQKRKSDVKQASQRERSKLQNEIKELQKQLLKESQQVSAKNISCEHFIRELGQWYEANLEDANAHEQNELLVNLASKLLLAGYPLELLDGENAYIPIKWISDVLTNLAKTLNNPSIFVLSIIGIQSSGKSTLLNSMFGVRFPVRAGRCTRGVYLQLLEVNAALHEQLGFKYLLIIDTEGLQSPDRTVLNDHTFDNLVATLTMCIGDLTLLNIGQETIGPDMIGILQIVVHAMIRMKKVNLVSNCRIIQQRVSDIAAAANNKSNMAKIKDVLNKVTRTAAAEEKVDNIHDFSDVCPMVEGDDLQFFPCLWTGLMSPPNSGYSDQIHALKSAILLQDNISITLPQFTMEKFTRILADVWDAVKSEDFVFNFQNSFDALSNQRFRLEHNILIGKMRTDLTEWELRDSNNLSSATKDEFFSKVKIEINKKCEIVNEKIDEYVKTHNDEAEVNRRQQSVKNETFDIGRDIQRAIEVNTDIFLQSKEEIQYMPHFIKQAKQELKQAAKNTALHLLKKNPDIYIENRTKLDNEFDELWRKKTQELEEKFSETKISDKVIDEACANSLSALLLETEYSKTYKGKIGFLEKLANLMSSGSRHEITATNELEKILSACLRKIRKQKHMKPFHQNHVDTVLNKMYNTLKTHKVNSEFLVNSLVKASRDLAKANKECQAEYEKAYSLKALFEKEKIYLKNDFIAFFDETIKIDAAVDRIYSELMTATQDIVVNILNVTLLSKMRTDNCYNNKERLIGKILEELLHKKNAQFFVDFIKQNETFVYSWLREAVLETMKLEDDWVITLILEELDNVLRGITTALRETGACFIEDEAGTTFKKWALKFELHSSIRAHRFCIESVAEDFDLSDVKGFTDSLTKVVLENLKKDIQVALHLGNSNVLDETVASFLYSKMKKNVAQEILDHLGVCNEVCPFCKVTCHLQISGEHTHVATFHYPQGVAGFRWLDSKDLMPSPCTLLMATDCSYRMRADAKWKKYKDYKTDYKSWYIEPIKADKPIHYWMWVLSTFNDEFARVYNAKPAKIPEEWESVTQEMAIKSLREQYKHHE